MPATASRERRRLYRRRDDRLVAGVASGLADHLGVSVIVLRIGFVLAVVVAGLGVLLYAAFWALVPLGPSMPERARRERTDAEWLQLIGFAALGVSILFVAQILGFGASLLWPATAALTGAAILWRQADEGQRDRWREATARGTRFVTTSERRRSAFRWVAGSVLVLAGLAAFLALHGQIPQARRAFLPLLIVVVGLLLVIGPWMLQTFQQLGAERTARIRERERIELAGRVHDSMLQTLTLIQKHADDPVEVQRLVRYSERELRGWLYGSDRPETLRAAMVAIRNDVEDEYAVMVDLVMVGDHEATEPVEAVARATREAVVNAAKHSGVGRIDVYVEVSASEIGAFVRDRGNGFDVDAVPVDRFGVRESVVARMVRHGGDATIRSAAGSGTEVRLRLPLNATVSP